MSTLASHSVRRAYPIILLLSSLLWPGNLFAEEDNDDYKIVVTSRREKENAFESPRAIDVVDAKTLLERNPASSPQALENELGVTMQRTHGAGGAPIMRGMLGQHVLLLVDGIRLNNAITRFGPNQKLNTVDPYQLGSIEILRGPGSVAYGSDALGGVINLKTRRPVFDPERAWDYGLRMLGRFSSADLGGTGQLAAEGHLREFGLNVGGSFKHVGDVHGGYDTGLQKFTGHDEGNAYATFSWDLGESGKVEVSYSMLKQYGAPRTDKSTPLDFTLFSQQLRDLASVRYSAEFEDSWLDQIQAQISLHSQREERERHRLANDTIDREWDADQSLGAQLSMTSALPYNRLTYGFDLYHDWIQSTAERETMSNGLVSPATRGRYIDGSRYLQLGVFLMDHISVGQRFALDAGGRFNAWWAHIPADPSATIPSAAFNPSNVTAVGSLHARYLVGSGINLVAGVSQGYRAPNIDDYSAQGCSGQGYDIANSDLKPEKSVTAEAGVKLAFDLIFGVEASVFYYFTYLDDAIIRQSATLQGPSGPITQVQCGTASNGSPEMADIKMRTNAEVARIHGVEGNLKFRIGNHWSIFGSLTWTHGNVELPGGVEEPLGRVPPLNGLAGVRYQADEGRWFVEAAMRWAQAQTRLSSNDLSDTRICPGGAAGCTGTPGYLVFRLRAAARLNNYVRLLATAENLSHTSYRTHGSGVDGPGLSAILGLELNYP
jgi:hemoglobin/transferrin/lactoferrin receptor protein